MSLTGALEAVANRGSGHGITLFRGDKATERIGFDQLYREAGELACGLLDRGVEPQERVAIALPTSIDFARAFFGVLAAGAVPVPVPPPFRFASLEVHVRRIAIAMRQSQVKRILSNKSLGGVLEPALGGTDGELTVLGVGETQAASAVYADVSDDHPALVQYTSGTVADPKGVVLSHANLLANVASITKALDCTDADVSCTWLPLFHDMGLIGAFLTAVLNDTETCMMPPEDFLRDPSRWVRVISQHGGSITTAPNSGYLHALRKVPAETVRELDLSRWRLALTGAEAVDAEVVRRFATHFAPAGFKETAFLPVYGLAEGSLAVSFPPVGRPMLTTWVRRDRLSEGAVSFTPEGSNAARELVSVGTPVDHTEVRLCGDDGAVLHGDATVGEIQIRGASVTCGYEGNQRATQETIHDGGWLSTGDLGFHHEGELFIAGRKKEMVIVFGQNYYASDIESIAIATPGPTIHGALAASIAFPEGEQLVLFVEIRETDPAVRAEAVSKVRHAVSSALGVAPREVIPVRRGKLPRTSSGKLLRRGVEALYEELRPAAAPAVVGAGSSAL